MILLHCPDAADQSSILILILLVFLSQIPGSAGQSSAKGQKQQPDQRFPVVTGLRRGRRLRACRRRGRIRRVGRICGVRGSLRGLRLRFFLRRILHDNRLDLAGFRDRKLHISLAGRPAGEGSSGRNHLF